jgi:hypothetical protein
MDYALPFITGFLACLAILLLADTVCLYRKLTARDRLMNIVARENGRKFLNHKQRCLLSGEDLAG